MKNIPFPTKKSFLCDATLAPSIEAAHDLSDVHCQLITASMRDIVHARPTRALTQTVDLLKRACTVSVEPLKSIKQMPG